MKRLVAFWRHKDEGPLTSHRGRRRSRIVALAPKSSIDQKKSEAGITEVGLVTVTLAYNCVAIRLLFAGHIWPRRQRVGSV